MILVFVCAVAYTLFDNFSWSESLGYYYTGHYSITVGDLINGKEPTYYETHLSLFEMLIKVFEIWFS